MKKTFFLGLLSAFALLAIPMTLTAQNDPNVNQGLLKQKSGNHSGAIADFTEAIKANISEVQKYMKELEAYNKISDFEKAEKELKPPPVDAKYAVPYYLRGVSYSVMGNNDKALDDFNMAISIDPKLGKAYYERGRLLWTLGKKDEGCIDLGRGGSLKDSLSRDLFDEKFCWKEAVTNASDAASKLRLNDYQGALTAIEKSIQLCPDSANYLGMRGRALYGLGKVEAAMRDFDRAISLSNTCVDAFYGRGMAFLQKRKYQEAFDDLAKALALNNKLADAFLQRAAACEGMGKNSSALFDYQEYQRLKPSDANGFYKSGLLRNEMGDKKGACNDFKRAAAIGHQEAEGYLSQCK